ncbi:hypothetical protein RJ641_014269 [Dillenia turbinata]|uniref:UDP-N-acetylglucosamine--peptide N-acetylglucosaminyltransferase SPINDLY n=1 Tax=Dillenia turbinata TaxID=194707 RepID=A0AAN8UZK6_9MAGN
MPEPQELQQTTNNKQSQPGKAELPNPQNSQPSRLVVLADLNVDPPESDDIETPNLSRLNNDENSQDKNNIVPREVDTLDGNNAKPSNNKSAKASRSSRMSCASVDSVAEGDADQQQSQGVSSSSSSREEKVSSLKTGLVHVARKMPKNAHAQFILGLMYQRLGQPQKAISAYEKAEELLLRSDEEIDRPELLSLVQIHHAQCCLLGSSDDYGLDKELEPEELEEILLKLKMTLQSDIRHAAVWNTLGLILLKTGRLQSAISVLSSLLAVAPDNLDCLANLGIAYLQSGDLELSEKCFQDLVLKDQNHPAALVNYATLLLCKHGSAVAGAGAKAAEKASTDQATAINVAKDCLLTAVKADPKAPHIWVNLANAYYMAGDHRSSSKCLEKAAKMEPACMSIRYAVAVHRMKDVERSQDPNEQLFWAGNEMASILREGDSSTIEPPIAWAGLAMVHKAQHEIAAAFDTKENELAEVEERAQHILKQAVAEDPDDALHWHQLGLHSLCTQQFQTSQKYLKAAIARFKNCSYAWSNLGIALQLSEDPSRAEEAYKQALSMATPQQAHAIFSNLGNFYRQQKQYESAKAMFTKSLELRPGYAPAYNNLGLVFVAEGRWEEAKFCFNKAILSDPLLDTAKSNMVKIVSMSKACAGMSTCTIQE